MLFESSDVLSRIKKQVDLLQSKIAQFLLPEEVSNKEDLKNEVESIKWNLIEASVDSESKAKAFQKIKNKRMQPFFLWKLEFIDVFRNNNGFDIVIGNPPYIQMQKEIEGNKLSKLYKNTNYETFDNKGDIYTLFNELGINLLKKDGHLIFINSNKWMWASYGVALRKYFTSFNPKVLIDFTGEKIFKSATVDTNILLIQKNSNSKKLMGCNYHPKNDEEKNIHKYLSKNKSSISNETWFIGDDVSNNLKNKIASIGKKLKDFDVTIKYGVKTGFNKAFIIDENKYRELIKKDKKNSELIKPILRGRDVDFYKCNFKNLYLILAKFNSYTKIQNEYPDIYQHLNAYQKALEERGQCKNNTYRNKSSDYPGQHHWLELDNNPSDEYIKLFHEDKIIYPIMASKSSFYYDQEGYFCNDKAYIINGNNLKYLIAILNSKLIYYYLKTVCSPLGSAAVEYRKIYLDNCPIPLINEINKPIILELEKIVDDIIVNSSQQDSLEKIRRINILVFKLYGLDESEIKLINDSFPEEY